MKIVVIGTEPLTGESWRPDCADGLRQLGHHVASPQGASPQDIAALSADADVLIWLREHRLPDSEMRDCLRRLEDAGTATVALHLDLNHGVPHRDPQIGKTAWWSCQWVFTADGGDRDWRGVNHQWCPPAFGTRFIGLASPDDKYRHAATFVGSSISSVHGGHRAAMLDWAERAYGTKFVRYGETSPMWGADLNTLYSSSALVLGDSAQQASFYWSDRVPRTLGRGGILAHHRTAGMAEMGFTDEAMILYEPWQFHEIKERRDSMNSSEVRHMREAAITVVQERHTWRHRMAQLLKTVGAA